MKKLDTSAGEARIYDQAKDKPKKGKAVFVLCLIGGGANAGVNFLADLFEHGKLRSRRRLADDFGKGCGVAAVSKVWLKVARDKGFETEGP